MTDKTTARPYPLDYKSWVYGLGNDKPRFLHTMFCVNDLDASKRFYVDALGMTLFDRMDFDFAPRVSALFVGYDINEGVMELSHYWDGDGPYRRRPGFGHVAIGVPDLNGILARLKSLGIHIRKPPVVVIEGAPAAAFLDDPDGYEIELIQSRNA